MDERNLQQRLLAVREQIPALSKKNYNEEVSYDFTKIDDIYKYLTPAMNRAGVVMDVVSEKATRRDAGGNPIYVIRLEDTGFWMYEADLTIVWKNTDNPEDMETVTLHAIGTNEMPDKAKGSAWTYLLKYYFFQKFAINQGGEDPDMNPAVKKNGEKEKWSEPAQRTTGQHEKKETGGQPEGDGKGNSQGTGSTAAFPDGTAKKAQGQILTVEDARNLVCTFGFNKGKTMGQIADDPINGMQRLTWFADSYHGRDSRYRQAAGLLLQAMQEEEADADAA